MYLTLKRDKQRLGGLLTFLQFFFASASLSVAVTRS